MPAIVPVFRGRYHNDSNSVDQYDAMRSLRFRLGLARFCAGERRIRKGTSSCWMVRKRS